jgi:threonine dehydrogenase-like Zn-dependent dehydrogenase
VGKVALLANENAAPAGATSLSWPTSPEALEQTRTRLGGYGADFVFGCDGSSEARRLAIEIARPAGIIVLMADADMPVSMNPNLLVFTDKRVQGRGPFNEEDLHIARNLIESRRV